MPLHALKEKKNPYLARLMKACIVVVLPYAFFFFFFIALNFVCNELTSPTHHFVTEYVYDWLLSSCNETLSHERWAVTRRVCDRKRGDNTIMIIIILIIIIETSKSLGGSCVRLSVGLLLSTRR